MAILQARLANPGMASDFMQDDPHSPLVAPENALPGEMPASGRARRDQGTPRKKPRSKGPDSEKADRLRQQKSALLKLAKTRFHSFRNAPSCFRRIAEVTLRCLTLSRAGVWLVSPDGTHMRCHELLEQLAAKSSCGPELEISRYPHYFRFLGAQRTIAAADVRTDVRLIEFREDYMLPNGISSSLDAAIRSNGRVVGVLRLETREARKWTPDEEQFAGSVADIAALALKDTELKRADSQRKAFGALGKKLNACTTPQMAVRMIGQTAQQLWGWDALFLHLYDEHSDRLLPVLNMDTVGGRRVRVPVNSTESVERLKVLMAHKRLLLNGELPPEFNLAPFGDKQRKSRSRMYTTIRNKARVLAILSIQSYSADAYDETALDGLEALGEYCTGAISRLQAEALRRESEERFRGLAAATTEGILIHSATRIFEVNSKLSKIFGYTGEELKAKSLQSLLAPDGNGDGHLARESSLEGMGLRKDGSIFPLEMVTGSCRYLGKPARVTVIRDISERKKIEGQLRDHSRQILEAQEIERGRVSRDLHDNVNQILTAARFNLEAVGHSLPPSEKTGSAYFKKTQDLLAKAMDEIRLISWNLRPNELDETGMPGAVQTLCADCQERSGIAIICDFPDPPPRLASESAITLFRILQEALNNACRHSAASRITIKIQCDSTHLTMEMADDGVGFSPRSTHASGRKRGGLGLTNMRERALSVAGAFDLRSAPGKGTVIRLALPLVPQKKSRPADRLIP